MLGHDAAAQTGRVEATCRCSAGKESRNAFQISGMRSHSFLLSQPPVTQKPECNGCDWR